MREPALAAVDPGDVDVVRLQVTRGQARQVAIVVDEEQPDSLCRRRGGFTRFAHANTLTPTATGGPCAMLLEFANLRRRRVDRDRGVVTEATSGCPKSVEDRRGVSKCCER